MGDKIKAHVTGNWMDQPSDYAHLELVFIDVCVEINDTLSYKDLKKVWVVGLLEHYLASSWLDVRLGKEAGKGLTSCKGAYSF